MTQRPRYPRICCFVIGCNCGSTYYEPGTEYLCPKHYRLVDRALKALRRRARRKGKRRLAWMLWERMKRQATERALGISA